MEEISIQRAFKTTIQILYDAELFDNFPNADGVLKVFLFVTRRRGVLEESKCCCSMTLWIYIKSYQVLSSLLKMMFVIHTIIRVFIMGYSYNYICTWTYVSHLWFIRLFEFLYRGILTNIWGDITWFRGSKC